MVPLVCMEEHHEAFWIWRRAAALGWLPGAGNRLLHVDEHADLRLPALTTSLHALEADADALHRFTYEELGIADFIVPSLYLGLFDRIDWLRRAHHSAVRAKRLYVVSVEGDGRRLRLMDNGFQAGLLDPAGRKRVEYRPIGLATPSDPSASTPKPWVLDIDLDYFHSDDPAAETLEIQITEAEYRAYRDDRYHRVRLSGGRARAFRRGGHYYYAFADQPDRASPPFRRATIIGRIEAFGDWLKGQAVQPRLVTLCRSSISGYMPAEQVDWVERRLLATLELLYPLRRACLA